MRKLTLSIFLILGLSFLQTGNADTQINNLGPFKTDFIKGNHGVANQSGFYLNMFKTDGGCIQTALCILDDTGAILASPINKSALGGRLNANNHIWDLTNGIYIIVVKSEIDNRQQIYTYNSIDNILYQIKDNFNNNNNAPLPLRSIVKDGFTYIYNNYQSGNDGSTNIYKVNNVTGELIRNNETQDFYCVYGNMEQDCIDVPLISDTLISNKDRSEYFYVYQQNLIYRTENKLLSKNYNDSIGSFVIEELQDLELQTIGFDDAPSAFFNFQIIDLDEYLYSVGYTTYTVNTRTGQKTAEDGYLLRYGAGKKYLMIPNADVISGFEATNYGFPHVSYRSDETSSQVFYFYENFDDDFIYQVQNINGFSVIEYSPTQDNGDSGGGDLGTTDPIGDGIGYDEGIWDFDRDGDGDVSIGEFFSGVGNVFNYIMKKLIDFFANLREFINTFGNMFTTEDKSFSFIISAHASIGSDILPDQEQTEGSMFYNVGNFLKYGIVFIMLIFGLLALTIGKHD